jgi:Tol biopolymer transport system component
LADCLDENTILALFRGALSITDVAKIDAHIDRCSGCRVLVSRYASRDEGAAAAASLEATKRSADALQERPAPGVDAQAPDEPRRWPVGTVFADRFELRESFRSGGMGQVYRAVDRQTGESVAIKIVHGVRDDERRRFEREGRLLSDLAHSAIVRYVARGLAPDGSPFFAMEWLEGEDLAQRLARGPLGVDQTRLLGERVASALAEAHAMGVVHRDIKPSNVFLPDGDVARAKILDFGVAFTAPAASAHATLTRTGALLGTLAYMAPEQARGAKAVDARADVFSLGCVLFECLTGTRAFAGVHAVEVLAKILADPAPRPKKLAPEVPYDLDALVTKMLAKDPAQRPQGCARVAELLRTPRAGLARALPEPRKHVVWILAAGVAMGTVATARFVGIGPWRSAQDRPAASAHGAPPRAPFHPVRLRRVTFDEECAEFPSFTPDARAIVYDATVGPDSFVFLRDLEGGAPLKLTNQPGWNMAPSVSPDGTQIAFLRIAAGERSNVVIDRSGATPPRALGTGGSARPSWSRDGRSIWTGTEGQVSRYDVASGALLETIPLFPGAFVRATLELPKGLLVAVPRGRASSLAGAALLDENRSLRWLLRDDIQEVLAATPDGQRILSARLRGTGDTELVEIFLDGSPAVSLASAGIAPRKGVAFSADGRHVAWSTCDALTKLVYVDDARMPPLLPAWQWDETAVHQIRNGRSAIVLSGRSGTEQPWLVDFDRPNAPRPVISGDLRATGISVSDDGAWLAFATLDHGLFAVPVEGGPPHRLTQTTKDAAPSFVRGSHAVLFHTILPDGHTQIQQVSVHGGEPSVVLTRGRAPSASPVDDRVVYFAGDTNPKLLPMILDRKTGRTTPLSAALREGPYRELAFSPDGKRVVVVKGEPEQVEIDLRTGAVVRTFLMDALHAAYVDGKLVLAKRRWAGDIWMADTPFGE